MTDDNQYESSIEEAQKYRAEQQILDSRMDFSWGLREWSIESIIEKFSDEIDDDGNTINERELFIPDYQRDYKWDNKIASRFIESILLGFPIPYLYIASVEDIDDQDQDGRIEIIDGSQRIRALCYFVNNEFQLTDLKQLQELDGFKFKDFLTGRKRKFLRESLRFMELKSDATGDYRRDLFERINSGNVSLNPMEVRRGSNDALSEFYTNVIVVCSESPLFKELAPFSSQKNANRDREELVLRFFAYSEMLTEYNGNVRKFLDLYLDSKAKEKTIDAEKYIRNFNDMLDFVKTTFPYGFRKTERSKTTFRTYFESIALGVYFAQQSKRTLSSDISWLSSKEYKQIIASDAANNKSKVNARISYVTEKLSKE